MKHKRCGEEQIIPIMKEQQAGAPVPELARRLGVVENTTKCGNMAIGEAKRPRDLEQDVARRKKLFAAGELDKAALKERVQGNWRRLCSGNPLRNAARATISANDAPATCWG